MYKPLIYILLKNPCHAESSFVPKAGRMSGGSHFVKKVENYVELYNDSTRNMWVEEWLRSSSCTPTTKILPNLNLILSIFRVPISYCV